MELRDYQQETLDEMDRLQREGITRQLTVLPTGGGKTVIFATAIKERDEKTLVLAHRDKLLQQAKDKIEMIDEGADVGVVKAERDELDRQIVVASVQTASRPNRLEALKRQDFKVCIVDEAHRAISPSYMKIFEELGFLEEGTDKLLLGFTATPDRTDGKGLDKVFQKENASISIMTLIRADYLSDVRGISVTTDTDISKVRTRGDDFVEYELAQAINTPERNRLVVDSYLKHAADRKALVFCANVQHIKDMHAEFLHAGIKAGAVHSKMPQEAIDRALDQYAAGEIKVLINCMILAEGYDDPPTSAILMARPTKSRIVYSQAVGRGTRKFPEKRDCLVIDFCDNRHDICALPTMFGWKRDEMKNGESFLEAERRQRGERALLLQKRKAEQLDLLDRSRFHWIKTPNNLWIINVKPNVYVRLKPSGKGFMVEVVNHQHAQPLHRKPLDFGYAIGKAEDYARREAPLYFAGKDAKWRKDPASDPQRRFLRNLGRHKEADDPNTTKGEACDLIFILTTEKNAI